MGKRGKRERREREKRVRGGEWEERSETRRVKIRAKGEESRGK